MCKHIVDPGVVQRQSTIDGEQLERALVLLRELVPVESVHHLDHAYHPVPAHYGHTQDTLGRVARLFVDIAIEAGVLISIGDINDLKNDKDKTDAEIIHMKQVVSLKRRFFRG